jgi:PhnB protein
MTSNFTLYLSFKDTRGALNFYQSVFGGEVTINTFGDYNIPDAPPDGVMHGQLTVDGKPLIMASEVWDGQYEIKGFSISLSGNNSEELKGFYEKLSKGGTISQPLVKSDWGSEFGIVIDQFGVSWMFDISLA